ITASKVLITSFGSLRKTCCPEPAKLLKLPKSATDRVSSTTWKYWMHSGHSLQVARVTSRHWPSTTEAWLRWKDSSARLFLKLPLNNYTSRLRRAADPKTIARTRNLFTSKGQTIMKKLILLLNFAALITTGAFQTGCSSNSIKTEHEQPKTEQQNKVAKE